MTIIKWLLLFIIFFCNYLRLLIVLFICKLAANLPQTVCQKLICIRILNLPQICCNCLSQICSNLSANLRQLFARGLIFWLRYSTKTIGHKLNLASFFFCKRTFLKQLYGISLNVVGSYGTMCWFAYFKEILITMFLLKFWTLTI